jgi:hypothetical protein
VSRSARNDRCKLLSGRDAVGAFRRKASAVPTSTPSQPPASHRPWRGCGIHQKLRRTCNVTTFRPTGFVQQVIAADRFSLGMLSDVTPAAQESAAPALWMFLAKKLRLQVRQRVKSTLCLHPSGQNLDRQCQPDNIHRLRSAAKL